MTTAEGYNVIINQTHDALKKENACMEAMLAANVEGILISVGLRTSRFDHLGQMKIKNMPMIYFDRVHENRGTLNVINNDVQRGVRSGRRSIGLGQ